MLHPDFRNNLIRIHLLYHAKNNNGVTVEKMHPEIESHGYETSKSEVKSQLDHLKSEKYLTLQNEKYMITEEGNKELSEAREKVKILDKEIN